MEHPEASAPLARLLGIALRRCSDDMHHRMQAAGFADHRNAYNNVMPHVPADGIRLTQLAERAGMTKQAMAELVEDLIQRGYLEKSKDPTDGRARLITFAPRGWIAVEAALKALREMEAKIAEEIGPEDLAHLRQTLLRLLPPEGGVHN